MYVALGFLIAYAAGSIPSAYLAGRLAGVDLRTKGSGNLGATNVVRVLGVRAGLVVFAVDILKGALPVALLPSVTAASGSRVWVGVLYGVAAVLGHVRPVWLRFAKGGKGVATACGVFLALTPIPTLLAIAVFIGVFVSSGYVSLGSLTAAAALPVLVWVQHGLHDPMFGVSVAVALFVGWTHRANMVRLRRGEEHRFHKVGNLPTTVGVLIGAIVAAAGVVCLFMRGGLR